MRGWRGLWPILPALALLALTPYPPTVPKGVAPQWTPVPGNPQVEYAANLKVDLFRCGGAYYYWVAGGWKEGRGPPAPGSPRPRCPAPC